MMKPTPKNGSHTARDERSKVSETSIKQGAGSAPVERSPYAESLLEACASQPRLQSFTSAIGAAGLADLLKANGPLTIFAPTDKAFEKIPSADLTALLGDAPRLADLIRHHVVDGRVKAPKATSPRKVKSQSGNALELTASPNGFHVDEARIVKTNIRATNGVIHAIDTVLGVG